MKIECDWVGMAIGLGLLGSFVSCSYNDSLDKQHQIWREEHQQLCPPTVDHPAPKAIT